MVLSEDVKWLIENVVNWMIVFLGMGGMFVMFIRYLSQQAKANSARDATVLQTQKDDNQQWRDTIKVVIDDITHVMQGQKIAIEGLGLSNAELYKLIKDDRVTMMAYQNTTSTALADLLGMTKEFRGMPADLRKANDTLGVIQKGQVGLSENESRRELETKAELARMNNAMLGIQTSMTKLEKAFENLPMAVQKAIAPTLTPIVAGIEELLRTARDTSKKIDDLPLMVGENSLIEKELSEGKEITPPPSPLPTSGEGEQKADDDKGELV